MKTDLTNYLAKSTSYFSEGHLECWFKDKYIALSQDEIKYQLNVNHDNSLELENAENELGRKLTDKENDSVIERFVFCVLDDIEFINDSARGYWDSLEELN